MSTDRDEAEKKRRAQERASSELKETEALLAGFDRPGRTPRPPPARADFVSYFDKRPPQQPAAPTTAGPPAAEPLGRERETFVIVRTSSRVPRWLAWACVVGAMPLAGGFIAYLGAREVGAPKVEPAPARVVLGSAAPPRSSPLPERAPSASSAPPPSASLLPSAAAPPPARAAPSPSSRDPRVDFIRKL